MNLLPPNRPHQRLAQLVATGCLVALCCVGPSWAQPEPAPAESRIALVTLYPGSATVERVAKLPAGTRKFAFNCLPANLDVPSLAVSADASVHLGELAVLTEATQAVPACNGSPLDGRIRELEDKKAALGAERDALNIVNAYLKSVVLPEATATGARVATDPKNIAAMADALRRTGQDGLARIGQIARQQEELDRALAPLVAERKRTQAARTRVTSVSVTLDAPKDAELHLSYQVNGPGWAPAYRALLDTTAKTLRLERQAQVAQNTGEDWTGVAMRLSTGQPRRGTAGPEPTPWRVGIAQPVLQAAPQVMRSMALAAPAPAPMAKHAAEQDGPAAPPVRFDVSVFENTFATEFVVPQRIDVPSNGQRVTLALGAVDASARLLVRSTPHLNASAWLVAEVAQPEGVWPSGSLQLYRDGAYVGADQLRAGQKGPLSLAFGLDELVVVHVAPEKDLRGSGGFVGQRAERKVERAYTVENRHRTAIQLQVLESAPVAVDQKVSVETKLEPKPDTSNWNEQPGVVLWTTTLAPGQTASYAASYTLSYPKDAELSESQ